EIPHEVLGLGQREVAGERDDEERPDAESLDRLLLLAKRLDPARGVVRAEHRQRMRLEGDRDGWARDVPGALRAVLEDAPVAEVDPVEVADRDDAASGQVGGAKRVADDPQRHSTTEPTRSYSWASVIRTRTISPGETSRSAVSLIRRRPSISGAWERS